MIGRNPVLEALHAGLPVRTAYVAEGAEHDSRLREILSFAADNGIVLMQATRGELDRMTGGSNHQGVALRLPEYEYATVDDIIDAGAQAYRGGLVVALDKITDHATWERSSARLPLSAPRACSSRLAARPR